MRPFARYDQCGLRGLRSAFALSVSVTDHDERLADLEAFFRLPWYRRIFGSTTQT